MQQQKKGLSKVFWVILALVLLVVLAGGWYFTMGSGKDIFSGSKTAATPSSQPAIKLKPTIIYSQEIAQNTDSNSQRQYPTVKLYRKVGDQTAEELATVGKVGEYPIGFVLSPDKNSLVINLESKLQILNLKTKSLEDLYAPRKRVSGVVFSPNGKNLFIWDQMYASSDSQYSVHNFVISSKKDSIIKEGTLSDHPGLLEPRGWRDDNKIVLVEPMGEVAATWTYDLETNLFTKTSDQNIYGVLSDDSEVMATPSKYVNDICNEMSGSTPSLHDVVDTLTGKVLGTVGLSNNFSVIEAFSAKNDEVLFYAYSPVTKSSECDQDLTKTYYTQKVSTGSQPVKVDNLESLLSTWKVDYIGAELKSTDGKQGAIKIGDRELVSSSKALGLIAQYYQ